MAGPTAAICEVAPPDRSDIVGACQPLPCSLVRLRDSLNIEPHALRKWQLRPEIDRVRGSTHIRLPCIGAGFATASGLLLATKAPPISAPEGPTFTLAMPQSEPVAETNLSASRTSSVKMEEVSPAPTALCIRIASSSTSQANAE